MTILTMLGDPVRSEFDIDKYGFALLSGFVFGCMLIGALSGGILADRYGRRVVLLVAVTVYCAFSLLSALAFDFYSFAASRGMAGWAFSAMIAPGVCVFVWVGGWVCWCVCVCVCVCMLCVCVLFTALRVLRRNTQICIILCCTRIM